uniref:Uncharacterized protein n=1 Tax=Mycena chlorophos TaxID=658473 RepID=A0ABQ0MDA5_MYCCL|nr:predicted protein [Mycena chlorophos]
MSDTFSTITFSLASVFDDEGPSMDLTAPSGSAGATNAATFQPLRLSADVEDATVDSAIPLNLDSDDGHDWLFSAPHAFKSSMLTTQLPTPHLLSPPRSQPPRHS